MTGWRSDKDDEMMGTSKKNRNDETAYIEEGGSQGDVSPPISG